MVRLRDAAYRERRADDCGVDRTAAGALQKVAGHIEPEAFARIFPELAAAAALAWLRDDELPAGFADFDRAVVDEAQDLTLLESAGVEELCVATARRRGACTRGCWRPATMGRRCGHRAWTGVRLNGLLAARLDVPRRFHFEGDL